MGISEISAKCNLPAWYPSKIPHKVDLGACKEIIPEKLEPGDPGSSGVEDGEVGNVPFFLPPQEALFPGMTKQAGKVVWKRHLIISL